MVLVRQPLACLLSPQKKFPFELCYSHILRRGYWRWCSGIRSCGSSPKPTSQHMRRTNLAPKWPSSYTVTGEGVAAYAVVVLGNC
jgi:hypothetical protein